MPLKVQESAGQGVRPGGQSCVQRRFLYSGFSGIIDAISN